MRRRRYASILFAVVLSACGQGTEPLGNFGDPSQISGPGLMLPISTTLTNFVPYSSSHDGFDLIGTFTGTAVTVRAPGVGFVVTSDPGSQTVTIMHNSNLYSKVTGVNPSVTLGSYVQGGSQIGTVANAVNVINFSVIANGMSVCPLSYLTSAARGQLTTTIYGFYASNPCQL